MYPNCISHCTAADRWKQRNRGTHTGGECGIGDVSEGSVANVAADHDKQ